MYKVKNAVIMAAGMSSRFAPLSYERPKALIEVRGEVLIERQIRQLQQAGVEDIYVVTGYMSDRFAYLEKACGVKLIHNPDYAVRNNNSSIYAVRHILDNTYVCSSDNYFTVNPFETQVEDAYYAGVYARGETKEWCMEIDCDDRITAVTVGGQDAWYMLGHTFWSRDFSQQFVKILEEEYDLPETKGLLWESIYQKHLDTLSMKLRRYSETEIMEFDTLDELREFDHTYVQHTRSAILKGVAAELSCKEADVTKIRVIKDKNGEAVGFTFRVFGKAYRYLYNKQKCEGVE